MIARIKDQYLLLANMHRASSKSLEKGQACFYVYGLLPYNAKGASGKYNIYLLISRSIENLSADSDNLLTFKDDCGVNFDQQMAVLQNQWRLNGVKIVDKTRARYLCARFARLATNPTHALMIYA